MTKHLASNKKNKGNMQSHIIYHKSNLWDIPRHFRRDLLSKNKKKKPMLHRHTDAYIDTWLILRKKG